MIAPRGLPADREARERCVELLLRCGADLSRVIDGRGQSAGAYVSQLAAIPDLGGAQPALVLAAYLLPLTELTALRRRIEERIWALCTAPWLLFANHGREPDWLDELRVFGAVESSPDAPLLWHSTDRREYLVVSPVMSRNAMNVAAEHVFAQPIPTRSTFRALRRLHSSAFPRSRIA